MTPTGIERATFRFVAQHLNHCAIAVLRIKQNFFLKLSLYLIKHQIIKTYVGMEAYIQIFLFSVLEVSGSAGLPRDS